MPKLTVNVRYAEDGGTRSFDAMPYLRDIYGEAGRWPASAEHVRPSALSEAVRRAIADGVLSEGGTPLAASFADASEYAVARYHVRVEDEVLDALRFDPLSFAYRATTTPKDDPRHSFDSVDVTGDLVMVAGRAYIHPRASLIRIDGELGKGPFVLHEVLPETLRLVRTR